MLRDPWRAPTSETQLAPCRVGDRTGPHPMGDVADKLVMKSTSLGPVRASLLRKGMIYSPAHGQVAFTVPLFDEFMRRVIPSFSPG